ncbi:MAG TPA: trehalose-6-phosphate synthase, partial [Elusimicrobiota bacterium]|nr:trehalose-6-phosphate synthase [Elusimicrobiota bacterium]
MRITFRIITPLLLVLTLVACVFAYFQVRHERDRQREELDRRARLIAESLQETVEPLVAGGRRLELKRLVERFGNRERLAGVAVYDAEGKPLAVTTSLSVALAATPAPLVGAPGGLVDSSRFETLGNREMHVYVLPLSAQGNVSGSLVLLHDVSYIRTQLFRIWRQAFLRVLIQMFLIALVTLLIIRWSVVDPITQMAEWMKKLRAGEEAEPSALPKAAIFAPIAKEVTTFARHLSAAKMAAEEEARLRQAAESLWTPDRLKEHVRTKLGGKPLFVVSNREPYMHVRRGNKIEYFVPAGGLVTALDPVLRSCGGTWIAHGAGDADWEGLDAQNRLRVPPEDPLYTLKRVALTKEEEDGYYYGFSNDGLWPLCHIAHTRPIFRSEDWAHYQRANQKFARAVLEELENIEEPCILIQDYHFALLPRFLKVLRPDARIALFWHIPWPNPEAFGICPWQKELLFGMLGADLIGYHTQFHCNNFLDTVDRTLETRIDWEHFAVNKEGHTTLVKPFPISVAFSDPGPSVPSEEDRKNLRETLLKQVGVKSAKHLGVGVDRLDYTKGI